jgi:hypothetical protein
MSIGPIEVLVLVFLLAFAPQLFVALVSFGLGIGG